ncbi:chitooligosaccharide deacetylase [Coleophoma cylindrospora]|uniref:Chitooligosaccharide deacetylase n=1 Tax=Coleophoma cylindrospora TaxID=1849047 RepID=A0A3D8R112_9HELO|nr:chitooligosaccharide deacetylase [Coleophoma cylindrospora]
MAPHYTMNPEYDMPRDFKGYGEHSLNPQWPNGAKIAVSFVINYEEGGERSVMTGDGQSEQNLRENPGGLPRINERNLSVESEYEYGSRVGFWRLFKLFNSFKYKFTLFGVGQALEQNPDAAVRCVQEGHDVASHAYRWIEYHDFSVEREKEYIKLAVASLKKLTGYAPRGWYYGRQSAQSKVLVAEVYKELGEPLLWQSDTYADDVPYWIDLPSERDLPDDQAKGQLMLPYSYDCNDFKFHVIGSGFADPAGFFDHLKRAFDVLYAEGVDGSPKMMTIGLHCRIAGRPGRFGALKEFVEYISQKEGVWVATRTEIAEHFTEKFPYRRGHLA